MTRGRFKDNMLLTLKMEEGNGKSKKTDCLLELPEGAQSHPYLDFGPVKPMSDFDL